MTSFSPQMYMVLTPSCDPSQANLDNDATVAMPVATPMRKLRDSKLRRDEVEGAEEVEGLSRGPTRGPTGANL